MWTLTNSGKLIEKIESKQDELTAWEWIEIWAIQDYSAMRWPAPDGFHVPLSTERQAVKDIRVALGGWSSDWANFGIALKLPFSGRRSYSNASIYNKGTYGYYWSSSPDHSNASNSYYLSFNSSSINFQNFSRANGYSVRCFKSSPTIPTSFWTKLYWTSIETGWIFWSNADWLISLSSDWQTWITIADKNLGATQVWNSWDTLSEANCGRYYQRWNNYGFPRAGDATITTSETQVDASNYWPWNYYESSTFIIWNNDWSSVQNDNLRWWVTWIVTLNNAITNTWVTSVNWQTWDVTIPTAEESNTKTFYLSWTSDLTNAQAVWDWYAAGKNPIIKYANIIYELSSNTGTALVFRWNVSQYNLWNYTNVRTENIKINASSGTVSSVELTTTSLATVLDTRIDYSTPYTPTYDWSPATKKYVDDSVSVVSWDSWVEYTIKVSNSAPASWTASNIITIVTD